MDNKRPEAWVVLASTCPGDLVASRSLLAALASLTPVLVHVRRPLAALLDGLRLDLRVHEAAIGVSDRDDEFVDELSSLGILEHSTVLDLIGSPPTLRWLSERAGRSVGYRLDPDEELPYDEGFPWRVAPKGARDSSHFGIRLLRAIPAYRDATTWPEGTLASSRFPTSSGPSTVDVALAAGCGKWGLEKRMPTSVWRAIAAEVRRRGCRPVWFLGPDERELVAELAEPDDEVVGGPWPEVLMAHARCGLGLSNDTVHMHIRAHLGRPTQAFFRRDDVDEWGHYPEVVDCLGPPHSLDDLGAVRAAIDWLDAKQRG